jgi:hypothetical protein
LRRPETNADTPGSTELVLLQPDMAEPRLELPEPDPVLEMPDKPASNTSSISPDVTPAPEFRNPEPPPALNSPEAGQPGVEIDALFQNSI